MVWAGDNKTFLYIEKDPETLLGFACAVTPSTAPITANVAADPLVWEQNDDSFYTQLYRTKDEKYLIIHTQSTVSSEVWFADAASAKLEFKLFLARERDHEYQVEHANGRWIVRTNYRAKNFRIVAVKPGDEGNRDKWQDVVAHRDDAFVDAYDVSKKFLTVEEHSDGLRKLRIRPWAGGKDVFVTADEPSYTMALDVNREFDTDKLRYTYTSMVTPRTTYDYDFATGQRELLKREPVLGGYDPANYSSEFAWATARDGTRVPVSIVYRKTTPRDGSAPLLQIGYGAYGSSYDPEFSYIPASLLDRGFVVAIAHIRGGQEMGRNWYEDGKLLNKKNTFTDFIDVTRWLAANKYNDPKKAFAIGRSAGGLLMGAIANMAPADYAGIVIGVPFVDVITTMLDESIPLTTNEFDEWGNPTGQEVLRLHVVVFAVRSVRRARLPRDVRALRFVGQPGAVLRADEVCRAAARASHRRQPRGVAHQHGSRARRQVRTLRALQGIRGAVRLHPRPGRQSGSSGSAASPRLDPATTAVGLAPLAVDLGQPNDRAGLTIQIHRDPCALIVGCENHARQHQVTEAGKFLVPDPQARLPGRRLVEFHGLRTDGFELGDQRFRLRTREAAKLRAVRVRQRAGDVSTGGEIRFEVEVVVRTGGIAVENGRHGLDDLEFPG